VKISVALCTHNGERYLEAQLRSILDGTRVPDEIVVSDDASTDATLEVARTVLGSAGVAHRILENSRALGVTANFEQAVRATTGDVIVLSDQDDVWHPARLGRIATELSTAGVVLRHSDARLIDDRGDALGTTLFARLRVRKDEIAAIGTGRAFETYLRRNLATGATTAFRRELLDDALPFPAEWVHDEWLAILAAARDAVRLVRDPEVDYRLHGTNPIGVACPRRLGRSRGPARSAIGRARRTARRPRSSGAGCHGRRESSVRRPPLAAARREDRAGSRHPARGGQRRLPTVCESALARRGARPVPARLSRRLLVRQRLGVLRSR
jgi:glycosyltransferase involved in cell wall biosynthesis